MSAFVVHPEHINVLIWAGLRRTGGLPYQLSWEHGNPTTTTTLDHDNRDAIGQMLIAENTASVNYRYNESNPAQDYSYRQPQHTTWSPAEILNALHSYEYQACEHPGWPTSQAHHFCRALERHIMRDLPGYNDGPWAISPTTAPLLEQRKAAMLARQQR